MGIAVIDPAEVAEVALESLGLNNVGVDLSSPEALAAAARRAASVHSPVSRRRLARLVAEPLRSLVPTDTEFDERLADTIEQLVAIGDLVERKVSPNGAQLVFLGMPRFVELGERSALLLGARPDGTPMLDEELMAMVEPESGARFLQLPSDSIENVAPILAAQGLLPVRRDQWMRLPRNKSAEQYLDAVALRARAGVRAGGLNEAQVFDPSTRPTYYRGRWRDIRSVTAGLVLLRRPQAYGADRWSAGWVIDGGIETLVDLPIDPQVRACDEAWRIMAALDRSQNQPLPAKAHAPLRGRVVVDLFSPPPAWLQRQLATLGYPVSRTPGSLLSYSVRAEALEHVRELLTTTMWVQWSEPEGGTDGS